MGIKLSQISFLLFTLLFSFTALSQNVSSTQIEDLMSELAQDSSSYTALYGIARAEAFNGNHEQSIQYYTKLLSIYPDDADALLGRGRVYGWMGKHDKALEDLNKVTQNHPDYMDAWHATGDICLWSNDLKGALKAYGTCLKLAPETPDLYLARARAYMLNRQFDKARSDLSTAKKLGYDPEVISQRLRELDRQPVGTSMEYSVLLDRQTFEIDRSDWTTLIFTAKRELSKGSLALQFQRVERFDLTNEAIAIESYFNTWQRSYGYGRIQYTNDATILPELDVALEIFQGMGVGWEFSGGFRRMSFPNDNVNVYVLSVSKYLGKWNIKAKSSLVPKEGKTADSYLVTVKRYFSTVDNFLEINLGREREMVQFTWLNNISVIESDVLSARYQRFLNKKVGFNIIFNLRDDELAGRQQGGALSLLFRI